MVLWEITLATAYWLGIRRTYRLALKLQRRLIPLRYARARDFLHRRTRNVFGVALSVHKGIQQRDLSAGKSLGNFILRFLDRARPSANIRGSGTNVKDVSTVKNRTETTGSLPIMKSTQGDATKRLFSRHDVTGTQIGSQLNNRYALGRIRPGNQSTSKSVPGVRSYIDLVNPGDTNLSASRLLRSKNNIFRDDIAQWMKRN